jgi:hypothetical protein
MYENNELRTDLDLHGRIVNGRVELDPFTAALSPANEPACATTVVDPSTGESFVALNAPFDPESVDLESIEA